MSHHQKHLYHGGGQKIPDSQTMANILQQSGSISYKHCRNSLQGEALIAVIIGFMEFSTRMKHGNQTL
ncbi:MAG: hypothetical protein Q9M92_14135 [Enterobacterales bacterium]|nr:hypothetical protein [Enterobacterales bacterium]